MPTWTAAMAVGHDGIDAQHRELFARADDLIDAMMQGRAAAETEQLLVFLRDYCREHFSTEEQLMAAHRYPLAKAHAMQHREFERRFKELEAEVAGRGATALSILGLKDLIRGWLVDHIATVDVKLASALAGNGRGGAR